MKAPLSYAPALPAATGIVSGILIYHTGYFVIPLILCAAIFVCLYATKRHYMSFFAIMTCIGLMLAYTMRPPQLSTGLYGSKYRYTGYVQRVIPGHTAMMYDVRVTTIDTTSVEPFDCRVNVNSLETPAIPGTKVSFTAKLQSLDSQVTIPYDTDYNKILRLNGLVAKCSVQQMDMVGSPGTLACITSHIRDGIYNAIVDSPISPQLASFLVATILGDGTLISPDEHEQYRSIGIAHILALSGLHVGILASLLMILLFPVRASRYGRILTSVITLCAVWAYVVIVGFTPSIARAATMLSIYICSRLIGGSSNAYNSLLFSVVIILAVDPNALYTPGFQLSVSAVASILMFGNLATRGLSRHPVTRYIVSMLTVPVAAMLGTGLVSIYYFNLFPGMFIFGNIIIGIMLPWLLGGGVVLMITTASGMSFGLLGSLLDLVYKLMLRAIEGLASAQTAVIDGIFVSGWVLLPYTIMLVAMAFALRYRHMYLWTATIVMLIATVLTAIFSTTSIPEAEMYIIGNSRSTQIVMRTGKCAYVLTSANQELHESENAELARLHQRFLASRGCGVMLERVNDSLKHGKFVVDGNLLRFGDRTLAIINSDSVYSGLPHTNYVLIAQRFTGHISDIVEVHHPDTILIGTDVQPQRRLRLLRELGDSIPHIDLREHPMAVVWTK